MGAHPDGNASSARRIIWGPVQVESQKDTY